MCEEVKSLKENLPERCALLGEDIAAAAVLSEILSEPDKEPRDLSISQMLTLIKLLREKMLCAAQKYDELRAIINL